MNQYSYRHDLRSIIKILIEKSLLFLILLVADLGSKYLIYSHIPVLNSSIKVFPWLNIVHIQNIGISFSFFSSSQIYSIPLVIISSIISIGFLLAMFQSNKRTLTIAYTLITAGAFGNLMDRILTGSVTDFIDLHIGLWHWFVFNLADIFISIGIIVFLMYTFFYKKKS